VLEIARARVPKAPPSRDSLKAAYGSLLQAIGRVGIVSIFEPSAEVIRKGKAAKRKR
jgi:hypothetical protein